MRISVKKWVYLFILSITWGSSFILIKKGLLGLNPIQLGSFRIVISGFFIFLVGFNSIKNLSITQWKWLTLSGFLGTFFPAFLFAFAETEVDSAVVSILNAFVPINTLILGYFVFGIKSNKFQFFGIFVGLVGGVLLVMEGNQLNPSQNYWFSGLVVLATLMYAANVNIIKRHLQEVRPLAIATANFAVIILPAIIMLLYSGGLSSHTIQGDNFNISLVSVVVLSLFGTAMAKVLFNNLIQISNPVFASTVTYLMPLVALFWGLLDGELFSGFQVLAVFLILAGIYLVNKKQ